jgi:hypothetical protein
MSSRKAEHVMDLVKRIRPILAGEGADVQGAVLADLLAMWLAGHVGPPDEIMALRSRVLITHIEGVCSLVPAARRL